MKRESSAPGSHLCGQAREHFERIVETLRAEEGLDMSDPDVHKPLSELARLLETHAAVRQEGGGHDEA